ncbi:MAG: hypothetical protein HY074_10990, partial [Deltaproteobacteria bacterium]|nr:hypothetical protein [Deltaproteobacteria bacterium]
MNNFASALLPSKLVTSRRLTIGALLALVLEFWVLFSDVHFLWHPTTASGPRNLVASVQAISSRVMVRSPLQLSWTRVSPGDSLYEGDEIATLGDATATIRFTDSEQLTLGANSMLALRRARSVTRQTVKLALVRGTLLQATGTTAANTSGNLEIEVSGRKLVTNGTAGFKIQSADQGEPLIRLNDSPLAKPLAATKLVPQRLAIETPEAAKLSGPDDGIIIADPDTVRLSWKTRSRPDLTALEIARDERFTQLILNRPVPNQTSWLFKPEYKGRYYWRVTSGTVGERVLASQVRFFDITRTLEKPKLIRPKIEQSTPTDSHKLRAPELKKPAVRYNESSAYWRLLHLAWSALIADAIAEDAPAQAPAPEPTDPPSVPASHYKVNLNWYGVAGAHAYTLQVATEPKFTHLVAEKVLTEPAYIWRSEVAGFYYWRVAAIDADGDRGPFSEFMTIDIKAERNVMGDDSTYETFLRYDEYSAHQQQFRLMLGPTLQRYHSSSTDTANSPANVSYARTTLRQAQVEYAYRVNSYYSVQFLLRTEAAGLRAENFRDRPGQNQINYNETIIGLGVERRFFEPSHYYSLAVGVRNSFIDIPTRDSDTQLTMTSFGFLGAYGIFGYHKPLSHA